MSAIPTLGWEVIKTADGTKHVVPEHDSREHTAELGCWCNPVPEDEGRIVAHNSADHREDYEHRGREFN